MFAKYNWQAFLCILFSSGTSCYAILSIEEFQHQLNSSVIQPFLLCIRGYNNALSHLARLVNSPSFNRDEPGEISHILTGSVAVMAENLQTSSRGAHVLVMATSDTVANLSSMISEIEQKLAANAVEERQNSEKLKGQKTELHQAEGALAAARNTLETSRQALRRAESDLENAENKCIIRRRRKRELISFLIGVVKGFMAYKAVQHNVLGVQTLACNLVNIFSRHINSARSQYHTSLSTLHAAEASVRQKNNEVAETSKHLAHLYQVKASLNHTFLQYQQELYSDKSMRDQMLIIDERMKNTTIFIQGVRDRGEQTVLVTELRYLIDTQNLVQPLMEIGDMLNRLNSSSNTTFVPALTGDQLSFLTRKIGTVAVE